MKKKSKKPDVRDIAPAMAATPPAIKIPRNPSRLGQLIGIRLSNEVDGETYHNAVAHQDNGALVLRDPFTGITYARLQGGPEQHQDFWDGRMIRLDLNTWATITNPVKMKPEPDAEKREAGHDHLFDDGPGFVGRAMAMADRKVTVADLRRYGMLSPLKVEGEGPKRLAPFCKVVIRREAEMTEKVIIVEVLLGGGLLTLKDAEGQTIFVIPAEAGVVEAFLNKQPVSTIFGTKVQILKM
jgi:hypothetical protein